MGEVYLARDKTLDRQVALKVLPAELANNPELLSRLQREAKALASVDHPNIVTVFSVEEDEGVHFLDTAYLSVIPVSEELRIEPRFVEMLERMKLPVSSSTLGK